MDRLTCTSQAIQVRAEPDKLKCAPEFARSDPLVALEAGCMRQHASNSLGPKQ